MSDTCLARKKGHCWHIYHPALKHGIYKPANEMPTAITYEITKTICCYCGDHK